MINLQLQTPNTPQAISIYYPAAAPELCVPIRGMQADVFLQFWTPELVHRQWGVPGGHGIVRGCVDVVGSAGAGCTWSEGGWVKGVGHAGLDAGLHRRGGE